MIANPKPTDSTSTASPVTPEIEVPFAQVQLTKEQEENIAFFVGGMSLTAFAAIIWICTRNKPDRLSPHQEFHTEGDIEMGRTS
jgi:hypothetical protein